MTSYPSVDDLRLATAVHRLGSVGAAARELLITQPSASARLASLERRLGVLLFDRDTTGARATSAGIAFATEAEHILGHLGALAERTHAGASAALLRVATFPSLGALLFPALEAVLAQEGGDVVASQYVDHGDRLIELVGEGSLDMAVVGLAEQLELPRGVTATPLGRDRLAAFVPDGVARPSGRKRPFVGPVPYHCVDLAGSEVERRIGALGGTARGAATAEVSILLARQGRTVALLSRAIAELYRRPGEQVVASPVPVAFSYHLVTRLPVPPLVRRLAPRLAARMGLVRGR